MNTDIVSYCSIFKCLGFNVKSIITYEKESSLTKNDTKGISVGFTCHKSGLRIEMEMENITCSCPSCEEADSSGVWHVSGTSGGVSVPNKDSGSSVLQHLSSRTVDFVKLHFKHMLDKVNVQSNVKKGYTSTPMKSRRFSAGKEVYDDIYLRRYNTDFNESNVSVSLTSLNVTPPKLYNVSKVDTPSRYRSLDALTNIKSPQEFIPEPGILTSKDQHRANTNVSKQKQICAKQFQKEISNIHSDKAVTRQNTYTAPEELLKVQKNSVLDPKSDPVSSRMMKAEKLAKDLLNVIHDVTEIFNNRRVPDPDTSGVSIALDASKISTIKPLTQGTNSNHLLVPSSRLSLPFGSSPNLLSPCKLTDGTKSNLKRTTSVSTPKIARATPDPNAVRKEPGIRKARSSCGPGLPTPTFGKKKETSSSVAGSVGSLTGLYKSLHEKPSVNAAAAQPKPVSNSISPRQLVNDAQSKRKSNLYSHIKSTIPKPTVPSKKGG